MSVLLFSLLLSAAAGEVPPEAKPVDPLDTVKCVREDIIGSIARKRKVCHTLREWESIRTHAQDESRRIIQPGVPTVSN